MKFSFKGRAFLPEVASRKSEIRLLGAWTPQHIQDEELFERASCFLKTVVGWSMPYVSWEPRTISKHAHTWV